MNLAGPGLARCAPQVESLRNSLNAVADGFNELERENSELRASVERLGRENGDQCDVIASLRQHIKELQSMVERAHT